MFSPLVFYGLSTLIAVYCKTVTSPQIRILDVATKASETRLVPNRVDHRNSYRPRLQSPFYPQRNRFQQNEGALKSYVIYDEYPLRVFREWQASSPADFSSPASQSFPDLNRQSTADFAPDYYYQNGQLLHPPKPTLAYSSVYSNVIKVFDNSLDNVNRNRFSGNGHFKPVEGVWKPQVGYEPVFPQEMSHRKPFQKQKLPANFPKVFSPNENFHFPIDDEPPQPPRFFYPQEGFHDTEVINYDQENNQRRPDEVETLPEINSNNAKRPFLCSFIRVNQRQFPENGPCGKSVDDVPITLPEYPDYSSFPNDKIPVEHRRQYFQMKRIKRSEWNETYDVRQKRDVGGFGYSSWGSPFGYESGNYDGYYSNNYPDRGYSRSRERSQSYRNRYGGRYDDYDDDYQNGDDSNSRGLTGYLTNGGRRYKNRKNNNEDDEDDEYDNENNRDEDSEEEMERMNSNRRDNGRRNNDDSRGRRRNNSNNSNNNNNNNSNSNNNNDDDDYRDNRRNRNSRRNNSNRRYNDRYDNNGRNRYYGNSNGYGYNNNGYGNSYLGYGNNYGGYGSGGYGSSYGSNGGYGYGGGYGNFGSF